MSNTSKAALITFGIVIFCVISIVCLCCGSFMYMVKDWGENEICTKQFTEDLQMRVIYSVNFEMSYHRFEFKYQDNDWQVVYYPRELEKIIYGKTLSTKSKEYCEDLRVERQGNYLLLGNVFYSSNNGRTINSWGETSAELKNTIDNYLILNNFIIEDYYIRESGKLEITEEGIKGNIQIMDENLTLAIASVIYTDNNMGWKVISITEK